MNCTKVQRLLPLMVGRELSPSKISAIESHLEECVRCKKDYERYVLSVKETQAWMAQDEKDWEENEWKRTIQNALKDSTIKPSPLVPWPFKRSWAYAFMALTAVILSLIILQPTFIGEKIGVRPETPSIAQVQFSEEFGQKFQQDIVSVTLVSKETGLKINWFFNKNFKFEEEK